MTWLRVDDKMPRHPKVEPLSDAAFRLHLHALAHCAELETDGFVSAAAVERLTAHRNKPRLIEELSAARGHRPDAEPLWSPAEGGWTIHGFLVRNPSHAQLQAKRDAAKHRMSAARAHDVRGSPATSSRERSREQSGNVPISFESPARGALTRAGAGSGIWDPDPARPEEQTGRAPPHPNGAANGAAHAAQPADAGESGYALAERCFLAAWAERYGERYVLNTNTGDKGDVAILQRLGRLVLEHGARAETVMRYRAAAYVADNDPWLIDKRHPLFGFERRLNQYVPVAPGLDDELDEDARAKREQDAEARRLAKAPGKPPSPELLAELSAKLAGGKS